MAGEIRVCRCRNVSYLDIRKAMFEGARSLEDIIDKTGAATCCGGCTSQVIEILESICRCNNISMKEVVEVVNKGADTVEKVGEITKAGTTCGRCRPLIDSVVKNKK